jgi:16S rRNA (guanine(1405)-N(7))-methyltransferase
VAPRLRSSAPAADAVDSVIERLCNSSKYRAVHADTVRDLVVRQAARARDSADLERLSRLRLHRAVAHYLSTTTPSSLTAELRGGVLGAGSDAEVRSWCRRAMGTHVSTAERLPDLDVFYRTLFDLIGPVAAIADLACALNVLSLPWLREVSAARYVGYDFNLAVIELGRRFVESADGNAALVHADVLVTPAVVTEDVALLLKTFHCLESRERGAGIRLVESVSSSVVIVSLPRHSRSGRPLGFGGGYAGQLSARAAELGWTIRSACVPTEEFWSIRKRGPDVAGS